MRAGAFCYVISVCVLRSPVQSQIFGYRPKIISSRRLWPGCAALMYLPSKTLTAAHGKPLTSSRFSGTFCARRCSPKSLGADLKLFPAGGCAREMQTTQSEPKQYINIARVRIVQSKRKNTIKIKKKERGSSAFFLPIKGLFYPFFFCGLRSPAQPIISLLRWWQCRCTLLHTTSRRESRSERSRSQRPRSRTDRRPPRS